MLSYKKKFKKFIGITSFLVAVVLVFTSVAVYASIPQDETGMITGATTGEDQNLDGDLGTGGDLGTDGDLGTGGDLGTDGDLGTGDVLTQQEDMLPNALFNTPQEIHLLPFWDGEYHTSNEDITKKHDCLECSGNQGRDDRNGLEWKVYNDGKFIRITVTKDLQYNTAVLKMGKYTMAFYYTRNFQAGDVLIIDGTQGATYNGDNSNISYCLLKYFPQKPEPVKKYDLTIYKQMEGEYWTDDTFWFSVTNDNGDVLEEIEITTENGEGNETLSLPAGEYRIRELHTEEEGFLYTPRYEPDEGIVEICKDDAEVWVYNALKEPPKGTLTIYKKIISDEAVDEDFTFILTDNEGEEQEIVIATTGGEGSIEINGLPYGTYTLTEKDAETEGFPYIPEIPDEGIIILDKEFTEITVSNYPIIPLPEVTLRVDKYVFNSSTGLWVEEAAFSGSTITATFRIVVTADIANWLAYLEKTGEESTLYINGYITDIMDGVPYNLPDNGVFFLHYINDQDMQLSQVFEFDVQLTAGTHTNDVQLVDASGDLIGELVVVNETDRVTITITPPSYPSPGPGTGGPTTFFAAPPEVTEDTPPTPPAPLPVSQPADETVIIEDEPIPLDVPVVIEDEPIPLSPVTVIIEDEPIPLADADMPQTGDNSMITFWLAGIWVSAIYLMYLAARRPRVKK